MPACNAEKTLERTVAELSEVVDIKILIDDSSAVMFGFKIEEISCPAKYFSEASSINFRLSMKCGLGAGDDRRFRCA